MSLWQKTMIALARSDALTSLMHRSATAQRLSARFVGGRDAAEAAEAAASLAKHGIRASLFYLGEYLNDEAAVRETVEELLAALPLFAREGLDLHVSADPTQIGLVQSRELARENAQRLGRAILEQDTNGRRKVLMVDMEDSSLTEATLALHEEMKLAELPVGVTVQAYLYRTMRDVERLIELGSFVRLVKGALSERRHVAWTRRSEISESYTALLRALFSPRAKERGVYPVVATHDSALLERAQELALQHGWQPCEWEIEMLFGVRPDLQQRLAAEGFGVRAYLPFGRRWFPYAIRRVGENPANALFVLRALAARSA